MTHPATDAVPSAVRAFVALDLDAPARAAVEQAVAEVRGECGVAVRWAAVDTLHLTLRFLSDVVPDTVAMLGVTRRAAAARLAPVRLRLRGAGAFPPRAWRRVLWIGVEPAPTLAALHRAGEDACAAVGLGRDGRAFRPHLTVARPRRSQPLAEPALAAALARVGFVTATRVASLHRMRSDLTPAGARHTPLGTFAIGTGTSGTAARGTPTLGGRGAVGGPALRAREAR